MKIQLEYGPNHAECPGCGHHGELGLEDDPPITNPGRPYNWGFALFLPSFEQDLGLYFRLNLYWFGVRVTT